MTALSVSSPFQESEWDRRLDTMLADLETGGQSNSTNNSVMKQQQQQFSTQQQSYSFSSSQQFSSSSSSQQKQQTMFNSQQQQHNSSIGYGGGGAPKPVSYSLAKSASAVSLQDSAGGVLKDLEDGLMKSSNYIQESHGKYSGPDGTREWHEVKRGEDPGEFNLERQVQHMIPTAHNSNTTSSNNASRSSRTQQQQQQQQFTAYKVQSNQYTGAGERVVSPPPLVIESEDDRPGSRLKQNIDELDTLLYDLNHARNLSPETIGGGGPDYTVTTSDAGGGGGLLSGLDSDDYSETVGKEGHVKRTVHAFNEYSAQMAYTDAAKKPPSPSPRRKAAPNSPPTVKRSMMMMATPPATPATSTRFQQSSMTSSSSSMTTTTTNNNNQQSYRQVPPPEHGITSYLPQPGPPGSGQPFTYTSDSPPPPRTSSPDLFTPSAYYAKYNSVKQSSSSTTTTTNINNNNNSSSSNLLSRTKSPPAAVEYPAAVPFPSQSARSPTPQCPPKRIDDLMSEFQEFDTAHGGGASSPPPGLFGTATPTRPGNSCVEVTELPDEPLVQARLEPAAPAPKKRDISPPPRSKPASPKGPDVFYPPGSDFSKPHPTADGGTMSLDRDGGKGRQGGDRAAAARGARYERGGGAGGDGGDKQGAAVIPICLPLCCAAPCNIL